MIPIAIQVSRSKVKVKPILYMLGKGALVFYKHLYLGTFINISKICSCNGCYYYI